MLLVTVRQKQILLVGSGGISAIFRYISYKWNLLSIFCIKNYILHRSLLIFRLAFNRT